MLKYADLVGIQSELRATILQKIVVSLQHSKVHYYDDSAVILSIVERNILTASLTSAADNSKSSTQEFPPPLVCRLLQFSKDI